MRRFVVAGVVLVAGLFAWINAASGSSPGATDATLQREVRTLQTQVSALKAEVGESGGPSLSNDLGALSSSVVAFQACIRHAVSEADFGGASDQGTVFAQFAEHC